MEIRPLEPGDYRSLAHDLNPWNYKEKGIAFFEWLDGFKPSENISMVALEDRKVIGYYGVVPISLKVGEETLTAYRGGFFVHPDHRRKSYNLLNLLVRKVHEEARKRKAAIYIFPLAKLDKYLRRRIRMVPLKPVSRYTCALKTGLPFPRLFNRTNFVRELSHFDKRFDALWDKASSKMNILSSRNSEFLERRYLKEIGQPNVVLAAEKNGEILGYIILKSPASSEKRGLILDLFDLQTPEITKALLKGAVHFFKKKNMAEIEIYLSSGYYEKALGSIGFLKSPPHQQGRKLLFAKHYAPGISENFFYHPDHWFITTTDLLFA